VHRIDAHTIARATRNELYAIVGRYECKPAFEGGVHGGHDRAGDV
jgi:hypothetical protein